MAMTRHSAVSSAWGVRRPLAFFVEERQLAEHLAGGADGEDDLAASLTDVPDLYLAPDDHVQMRPGGALAEEIRAALEGAGPDCRSKGLEIARGESFK